MSFLAPIAGLISAGIGSTLVILFWMLKLRRRPVRVSSTLLWKRAVRDVEGNIPWQRIRPSFLLFLQLIAVLLLSIAIARPVHDGGVTYGSEVVVVIDAGASMGAIADEDGNTRLEIAKQNSRALVRQIGSRSSETKFRVFRAGLVPQMLTGASTSWRQAVAAINGIEGSDAPSDLIAAMELVRSIESGDALEAESSGYDLQTFVFTDDVDTEISGAAVIQPRATDPDIRGNLGIVVASGQRDQAEPSRCRVFITIAGRVNAKTGVMVRAQIGDSVVASKPLTLEPDEDGVVEGTGTLVFELDTTAMVEISFERRDVLGVDDRVFVWMPDPSPIVTTVVAPDGVADPLLVDVLSAVTGGVVGEIGEGESVLAGTSLMVYDRVERDPRVMIPTIELISMTSENQRLHRVLTWERSHPTLRDVDLGSLRFVSPASIGGDTLATATSGSVISEIASEGIRHLMIGFALEDSNWGVDVSMPMFFSNAIGYLLPGTSGSGTVQRTNDPIGESGMIIDRVGLTEFEGETLGVSLLDRSQTMRASQVFDSNDPRDGVGTQSGATSVGRVEIWRWFVLAALVVLMLEWLLDLQRRRIA